MAHSLPRSFLLEKAGDSKPVYFDYCGHWGYLELDGNFPMNWRKLAKQAEPPLSRPQHDSDWTALMG